MTPGSDLPAALCEIHHLLAWRLGGLTDGKNLSFIGHRVHRNIDDLRENPNKFWTWFNPGQMLRFGLHVPQADPPFQRPICAECGKRVA